MTITISMIVNLEQIEIIMMPVNILSDIVHILSYRASSCPFSSKNFTLDVS